MTHSVTADSDHDGAALRRAGGHEFPDFLEALLARLFQEDPLRSRILSRRFPGVNARVALR